MQRMITGAALAASALALTVSPAMASGGKLFGGGATGGGGTTTTTTTSGGGGGGGTSGGGSGGGGVHDPTTTTTAPAPAPACATLANVTAPVGYYLTYAALWNDFTVKSCSGSIHTVNIHVTNTNRLTGAVDYDVTYAYSVGALANVNGVIDNDFAPFNTDYDVRIEARDESGNLLDSATTVATTPPPR
jgi:hypothetical protein